jgi:serine protease inhibitor
LTYFVEVGRVEVDWVEPLTGARADISGGAVMVKGVTVLLVALICVTLLSCGDRITSPDPGGSLPDRPGNPEPVRFGNGSGCDRQVLVRADNEFGLTLFREIASDDPRGNVVISPLSVSLALGMTVNGAQGATLDDMKSALGLAGYSMEEVNRQYRSIMRLLPSLDPAVELVTANSIWCRQGTPFKQDFLDLCHTWFRAQIASLDFSHPDASRTINGWVSDQTGGKITSIVDRNIDPLTMMFLINAVYFKGDWLHAFDPEETFDSHFISADGTYLPCRMMSQPETTDFYTLLSAPQFDALDMAYGDSVFSMTILLPKEGSTVGSIVRQLTPSNWNDWMEGFRPWSGRVLLPRFEIEYDLTMNDVLTALGMGIIFDPERADFTRICDVFGDFYVKKVKHKTYIRVDEIGTQAAAATSVEMGPTSVPDFFLVNRPFVLVIRENRLGTILFIGQINDPGYFTD